MSNLFSTVGNYSGRQPNNVQSIKQFVSSVNSFVNWIYKNSKTVITPSTDTDVLIPKNLYVNGSILNPSDINMKYDILPITDDFANNITNLDVIEFKYKGEQKIHYGLIAQNVEMYFPELVMTLDTDDRKTVNYIELIPLMLNKIKFLNQEINELKEIINEKEIINK
jgi:hypothetical protein